MAKPETYIEDVSMSNADNGVIISYCERKKNAGKGTYDSYDYNRRQEVFDVDDDDDESEEFEKAFDRFKELFKQARNYKISK